MRTVQTIFQDGTFKPLEPVKLPENTRITVALLDGDDLSPSAIAELASTGNAFDFLSDPREDIYSDSDGEAV